ncbi:MAG: helix-turn-helix domain-containing protein [Candidatus Doudnabacteria bacterium]|jgi:hypothetical protein
MLFEKKKIQIETLSEYLVAVRENLKLSGLEVSKKTTIKPLFLTALEQGDYKKLPADVYVLGFLRQLAGLYLISAETLIAQFKKEKGIDRQIQKQKYSSACPWYKKVFKKIIVTPKILSLTLGLFFVALTVGYIIWQVWSINKMPNLKISEPVNNTVIKASSVFVRGTTDPGLTVSINGENIFVDNKGFFEKQLSLNPGSKEIIVTAKNRFDKSISQTINIIGASVGGAETGKLELRADFSAAVVLGVGIDGQTAQNFSFQPGENKSFFAKDKIILSTTDAGATKVTVNGQSMGAMGRANEALNNIVFYSQTATSSTLK